MTSDEVVVVRDLRKRYGRVDALRGVTLRVRAGEIFGLLGPNGAGKTTLIKSLVGSSRPTAGSVRVLDHDPHRDARVVRPRIGYMPQAAALYEDLSARDNLRFFARAHGRDELDARIDDTLELTGLRSRENDAVYTFSGGMKQRVSLACALVHRPAILFLDEPTAGVDPKLRETFWAHFRALASRGTTLLVSTHQMDEALFCDRLAIVRDGRVLACEPPRDLLRRGKTRVRIARGDRIDETTLDDYATELPRLLQRSGLDPAVTNIEIERDNLETIVLALIAGVDQEGRGP